MKIRTGFVSNSSSSSFIIFSKKRTLSEADIIPIFKVDRNSPLYIVAVKIAECLVNESIRIDTPSLKNIYCHYDDDEIQKYMDKGFNVFCGEVSDMGGIIMELTTAMDIIYSDENLIIQKYKRNTL